MLLPAFDRPNQVSRLFAEHISLALGTHIAQTYGGMSDVLAPQRGGLATWQERRAKELMNANLQGDISTADTRERMLAVGRPFRSRVSAFDRSIAAPVAAPAPD